MENVLSTKGGEGVPENKFPERLRSLVRKEQRHRKRYAIAELCGLDRSTIRRYERGEREPGLTEFISIADHFDVSLDYMAGLTNNPARNT